MTFETEVAYIPIWARRDYISGIGKFEIRNVLVWGLIFRVSKIIWLLIILSPKNLIFRLEILCDRNYEGSLKKLA